MLFFSLNFLAFCEDDSLPWHQIITFPHIFKKLQFWSYVMALIKPASCFLCYCGGSCIRLTISNVIIDFSITVNTKKQFLFYREYLPNINAWRKLALIWLPSTRNIERWKMRLCMCMCKSTEILHSPRHLLSLALSTPSSFYRQNNRHALRAQIMPYFEHCHGHRLSELPKNWVQS